MNMIDDVSDVSDVKSSRLPEAVDGRRRDDEEPPANACWASGSYYGLRGTYAVNERLLYASWHRTQHRTTATPPRRG